jgi:hypothetical protein
MINLGKRSFFLLDIYMRLPCLHSHKPVLINSIAQEIRYGYSKNNTTIEDFLIIEFG